MKRRTWFIAISSPRISLLDPIRISQNAGWLILALQYRTTLIANERSETLELTSTSPLNKCVNSITMVRRLTFGPLAFQYILSYFASIRSSQEKEATCIINSVITKNTIRIRYHNLKHCSFLLTSQYRPSSNICSCGCLQESRSSDIPRQRP